MELREMQRSLAEFAARRDWQRFHTPKNLAMALAGEAGELLAVFQWLTEEQSATVMSEPDQAQQVRGELADVLAYLLRLADVLDVDLVSALRDKIALNETRYPEHLSRGNATKYDRLPGASGQVGVVGQ
jgi:NTP pyrophosphatase (non-canonical NTP hydrolase)